MITTAILMALWALLAGLIGLLPDGGVFPPEFLSSLSAIWSGMQLFSLILPIDTLLTIVVLSLVWHVFEWAWNTAMWIISIVRGVNMLR